MTVIHLPARLRAAISLLMLCLPVAVIETLIVTHAHWWNLPYRTLRVWTVVVVLICLLLSFWMAAGKRWGLALTGLFGGLWSLLSAWVSYRNGNPGLAFYALFLCAFWTAIYLFLRLEMHRSFLDPGLKWFQGMPEPIPGLICLPLSSGSLDQTKELKVSRLDEDGAFIFSNEDQKIEHPAQLQEIVLAFRGREIKCSGKTISILRGLSGLGFQFSGMSADKRKELGDFVEMLRGEGYVQ